MSRGARKEVVVVGGGVVGAACALALAGRGLDVALVEGAPPAPWRADAPDLRVYAFAADNVALFERLDAWTAVRAARVQAYRRMRVWDAAGGGALAFDADAIGVARGDEVAHRMRVDHRDQVGLECGGDPVDGGSVLVAQGGDRLLRVGGRA